LLFWSTATAWLLVPLVHRIADRRRSGKALSPAHERLEAGVVQVGKRRLDATPKMLMLLPSLVFHWFGRSFADSEYRRGVFD
jgi:hypothetical protein